MAYSSTFLYLVKEFTFQTYALFSIQLVATGEYNYQLGIYLTESHLYQGLFTTVETKIMKISR